MGHSIFTETGSFQFWIGIIKGIFTSLTGFIGFLFFLVALFCVHSVLKKKIGDVLAKRLIEDFPEEERERYLNCFLKNGKWYAPIFRKYPTGWSERLATSLKKLNSDVNIFIQKLNQEYTDPSGKKFINYTYTSYLGSYIRDFKWFLIDFGLGNLHRFSSYAISDTLHAISRETSLIFDKEG